MKKDLSDIRKDYIKGEMDVEKMNADPFLQFSNWFEEAYTIYKDDASGMSLSTVDDMGKPSSRIVLLKKIIDEGFVFYTNYLSRKGKEIEVNPYASLLFWWPQLERQVRIEGKLSKVSAEMSDQYFYSRPKESQIGAICSKQSKLLSDRELFENKVNNFSGDIVRPSHWGGYLLRPDYFEFWQGRANRLHDRLIYQKETSGDYRIFRLYP